MACSSIPPAPVHPPVRPPGRRPSRGSRRRPGSGNAPNSRFEPALTELRTLSRPDLDRLVQAWLTHAGLRRVEASQTRHAPATYQAVLDHPLTGRAARVQVRIHQRRNQLQAHHVEAFIGRLLRLGVSSGVLICTGGVSREARWIARLSEIPQIQLLGGEQWLAELALSKLGLRRLRLWGWALDLQKALPTWTRWRQRPGSHPAHPQDRQSGRRP